MGRRARNNNRIHSRHIELAESTKYHITPASVLKGLSSWQQAYDHAEAEIKRRNIVVQKKRRGAINWFRFSERATMIPAKRGPMLLPWDWDDRALRTRARTLTHELCHHEEDRQLAWYEALYLHNAWKWALETTCFGQEMRLMVASEVLGWEHPYTQDYRSRYISRLSAKIHKSYGMGRRYSKAEVERETRMVLSRHESAAHRELR